MKLFHPHHSKGFVFLAVAFVLSMVALAMGGTIATVGISRQKVAKSMERSFQTYYAAESGVEDATYRIKKLLSYSSSYTVPLGESSAVVTVSSQGQERIVSSEGALGATKRKIETKLFVSQQEADFRYAIQVGSGGLAIDNTSEVRGNVYVNGSIKGSTGSSITGDAWVAGASSIEGAAIGGDAHANTIRDSSVGKDAYYQTLVNTKVVGAKFPGSADPPLENLPLSPETIEEFKAQGDKGGVCGAAEGCDLVGDLKISGDQTKSLGPIKITGSLEVDNQAQLTLKGTLHVQGKVILKNQCKVGLDAAYQAASGVIVADGAIEVDNQCQISGSGDASSYLLLLSTASGDEAVKVKNSFTGAIFYAANGELLVENKAAVKEATAQKLRLRNQATVTYESGLAKVNFSSGPGGIFELRSWREIE